VREVSAWIWRVAPARAGTRRVTCRSVTVWPLRGPSLIASSTVESAGSYSWARPRSSVQVTVVNTSAGRSGAGPLRQVSRSNPAAVMSANSAGDQPPPVKAHRHPPAAANHLPQRREQAAQLAGQRVRRPGDDHEHWIAAGIGDPGLQRRGAGNFSRATWVFGTVRVP